MSPTRRPAKPREIPGLTRPRQPRLPSVAERTLPNGLRVVAVRRASVPLVQLRLRIPTAVRREGDLARMLLLQRSMMLGTAERSQGELAEALQHLGGSLRVYADADGLTMAGDSLAPELGSLLGLAAEVLTSSSYPRAGVEREADRFADGLRRALSQPGVLADEAWRGRAFGAHPYGRDLPSPDEVLEVPASSMRAAHRRRVGPDGALLVLVGDLRPTRALDQVERAWAGWTSGGTGSHVPALPTLEPGPLVLVDRPGAVQSNLRLGGPAPRRSEASYPAAEIANALFGGYFSSRLVTNIREDKGYTYSPYSVINNAAGGSWLTVAADVATEVTAPALLETSYELGRMASLPPSADEVAATAQYLVGSIALSTATQSGLADTLLDLLTDGQDVSWLREHPQRLAAVTPEQVHEASVPMLGPAGLVSAVVGDAEVVEGPLSALGAVVRG
ncbi:MAG: zinc protease [Nocardioidaceae bacterium]|nr:zinc protease [Nocardioidaceae bacterium]